MTFLLVSLDYLDRAAREDRRPPKGRGQQYWMREVECVGCGNEASGRLPLC